MAPKNNGKKMVKSIEIISIITVAIFLITANGNGFVSDAGIPLALHRGVEGFQINGDIAFLFFHSRTPFRTFVCIIA